MSAPQKKKERFAWSLWIPVTLAFLLAIIAWALLIKIAKEHPVERIEVEAELKSVEP